MIGFASILCSCNQSNTEVVTENTAKHINLLDSAKWFIGTWQSQSDDGVYTETWNLKNDSVYEGVSTVVVNQKDTVFYESITLEQKNQEVFYNVSVKDQNHGEPVSFKLVGFSDKQLVFENPTHDFPTKITYNRITEDSLVASISGKVEGKDKTEQFPMKKVK
ncbi:MAG: putative lipoprotein [Bacteroidota bacterium]|nr:putative lipoprotein [Bacteroidota bacterium]